MTLQRLSEDVASTRLQMVETIRNDFVWSVSHELRTPIANIIGYTEILKDGGPGELSFQQERMLGRIVGNATRLLTLVDDLLHSSRVEGGDPSFVPVELDLCALVRGAVTHAKGATGDKHLDLVVDVEAAPVVVTGDARDLLALVNSLLCNAIKFSSDGGRVSVSVSASRVGEEGVVVVTDSGCGIPAEEQALVFDRFYRSSISTRRAIPGTGLGLSTAQAIATMHGGWIEVESQVERGSRFTVHLPLAARAA